MIAMGSEPGDSASALAELDAIYRFAPVGLVLFDRDLRFVRVNEALARMNGLPVEAHVGNLAAEVLPPVTAAALEDIRARLLAGEAVVETEISGQSPWRGEMGHNLVAYRALRDASGEVTHFLGTVLDITDRKAAEAALAASNERLALAILAGGLGFADADLRTGAVYWSPELRAIAGLAPNEPAGGAWTAPEFVHPDDRARVQTEMEAALGGENAGKFQTEHRIVRTDGERRWVRVEGRVFFAADGAPQRALGVMRDVTARVRREERIEALMREVTHRSKNLLAVVQAVARQTAKSAPDDFRARFDDRLRSLAASHDLLVHAEWGGVSLDELAAVQLGPFADGEARVVRRGPTTSLNAAAAQTIGMALHELAVNAARYGALSTQTGVVDIAWDVDSGVFTLAWTERGGPPVEAPTSTGFGAQVIESLIRTAVGGEVLLTYARGGLTWRLVCDAARVLAAGA